ncbi:MAG: cysteine desulfurase [Chthonomonadales bacterium]
MAVTTLEKPETINTLAYDVEAIRRDFPILSRTVHGKPLVYLDSANTSQKPQVVIDAISNYYESYNSNIHRSTHHLSEVATKAYEDARGKIARFINAPSAKEVVFVRGCTEAINLVANSYARRQLKSGDEIIVSWMEHHSNIVPWQMVCEETGAVLKVVPITDEGLFDMAAYEKLLSPRTKMVSIIHVSNSMGTINPVKKIVEMAHRVGAIALVDGAQAVPHMTVDVQDIGCDFYTFSSHKMVGPTGQGALYGKMDLLKAMPPFMGGGDMIREVTFEKTTYNSVPYKFEAGTPNIADAIGFGAAVDYLTGVGMDRIAAWEHDLLVYGTELLGQIDGLRMIGTAPHKAGVLSFVMAGIHPHDIGTFLDQDGIAVRTGQHCCQPVMDRFEIPATTRASLALYNTRAELDALAVGLRKIQEIFA